MKLVSYEFPYPSSNSFRVLKNILFVLSKFSLIFCHFRPEVLSKFYLCLFQLFLPFVKFSPSFQGFQSISGQGRDDLNCPRIPDSHVKFTSTSSRSGLLKYFRQTTSIYEELWIVAGFSKMKKQAKKDSLPWNEQGRRRRGLIT